MPMPMPMPMPLAGAVGWLFEERIPSIRHLHYVRGGEGREGEGADGEESDHGVRTRAADVLRSD